MIKVAYDLSFVSLHYRRLSFEKFGIYQVADQVLQEISKSHCQSIELAITSLCSNRLYESFVGHALLSYDALQSPLNVKFEPCFKSKIGNIKSYFWLYDQLYSQSFAKQSSLRSQLLRGIRKIILSVLRVYQTWNLNYDFNLKDYDIFHSIYLGLPLQEKTGKLKRILTIHDLIPLLHPDWVSPTLVQDFKQNIIGTIRPDDFIICVSNYTKQQVCQYLNINQSQVFVTPLGASDCFHVFQDKHQSIEKLKSLSIEEKPYFMGVASLEYRKNTQFLIDCFCEFVQSQPDVEINLILVGSLNLNLQKSINSINHKTIKHTQGRILCTGYISDQYLSLLYNQALAFIFPSLYEGFGLPVLEALQCGTPVICSNTTALPEVAGDAAIFIDPQDPNTLITAMLQVYNDTQLRSSLSKKSIQQAQTFSWQKCAQLTIEAYHNVSRF